jgi:hypothetical protein
VSQKAFAQAFAPVADRPAETAQNRTLKRGSFLAAFASVGNISDAAKIAGVGRRTHYEWMEDPEYRLAFREACAQAADGLEREARRRAMVGVDEPVFYKGAICGYVRKYSDGLLQVLLRAYRPRRFRENLKIEQSGRLKVENEHRIDMSQFAAIRQELIGHPEILDEHRAEAARQSGAGDATSAAQPVPEKPPEAPQAGPNAKPETK